MRQGFLDKELDYYRILFEEFGERADFMVAELNPLHSLEEIDKRLKTNQTGMPHSKEQQKLLKQQTILQDVLNQSSSSCLLLACALIIYDEKEVTYLFGGSYSEFQKFSAPFLLQHTAMLQTMARNIYNYNFLGIQGVFDGSDGVLRFKQNFNGSIVRKVGTFRFYPFPIKYRMIQSIKKLLGRQ